MPRAVSEEQPRSGRELVGQIKDRSSKGHWVVGVCYSPPDQEEAVDETFLLQLQEVLCLQALVLMGDFSHLLGERHSGWQAIQEIPGVCQG